MTDRLTCPDKKSGYVSGKPVLHGYAPYYEWARYDLAGRVQYLEYHIDLLLARIAALEARQADLERQVADAEKREAIDLRQIQDDTKSLNKLAISEADLRAALQSIRVVASAAQDPLRLSCSMANAIPQIDAIARQALVQGAPDKKYVGPGQKLLKDMTLDDVGRLADTAPLPAPSSTGEPGQPGEKERPLCECEDDPCTCSGWNGVGR